MRLIIYLLEIAIIAGCINHITLNKSFIKNKMEAVLVEGWEIAEITENQFPFEGINKGSGSYKVTIEGKLQEITASGYGDNKGDWISEEITISPKYHIWFMPIELKEIINIKHKEIIDYEKKLQSHHQFMHPYLIGETSDIVIYGTYEKMGYDNVSEPIDFNWEILNILIKEELASFIK